VSAGKAREFTLGDDRSSGTPSSDGQLLTPTLRPELDPTVSSSTAQL